MCSSLFSFLTDKIFPFERFPEMAEPLVHKPKGSVVSDQPIASPGEAALLSRTASPQAVADLLQHQTGHF
jgi:hypothetical protein